MKNKDRDVNKDIEIASRTVGTTWYAIYENARTKKLTLVSDKGGMYTDDIADGAKELRKLKDLLNSLPL